MLTAALVAMVLAACGGAEEVATPTGEGEPEVEAPATLDALYEAALEEGEVAFWSGTPIDEFVPIIEAFNEDFPDIEIHHFDIRPGESVPRILAEASAGQINVDVVEGRINALSPLLVRDLIERHTDWQEIFDVPDEAIYDNGRLLVRTHLGFAVAYNTELVTPEEVPQAWEDLLDPRWSDGKILVESRGNAFNYLVLAWEEEEILEYLEQLRAQNPTFTRGGTATMEQLLAGAGELSVGSYMWQIANRRAEGHPVDWAPISPMGAGTTVGAVLRDAPNANAAKLWMGWLVSERGQEAILQVTHDASHTFGANPLIQELQEAGIELLAEDMENYHMIEAFSETVGDTLAGQ